MKVKPETSGQQKPGADQQALDNPFDEANIFSRNLFCWLHRLLGRGYRTKLDLKDVYKCPKEHEARFLGGFLREEWNKEALKHKQGMKASLLKAIFRSFGLQYLLLFVLAFASECVVRIIQCICLALLVNELCRDDKGKARDMIRIYLTSGTIIVTCLMYGSLSHPFYYGMSKIGMKVRIAICKIVYEKALRLSHAALKEATAGRMVNLLSNDVNRFDYCLQNIPFLFVGPTQVIIILVILWHNLDISCFTIIPLLVIFLLIQVVMGILFNRFRKQTATLSDERIRLMNEIIPALRVIKMYAWEVPFVRTVERARRREVHCILKTAILRGIQLTMIFASSKLIVFLTLVAFILMGNKLSATIVFLTITLCNSMRQTMIVALSYGVSDGAEVLISFTRLEQFLLLPELPEKTIEDKRADLKEGQQETGVWMEKASAEWVEIDPIKETARHEQPQHQAMSDITFTVKPGKLLIIVGPVGEGKSSILLAIIGELPLTSGSIRVQGKVAYASQEGWAFSGTVQENILFGKPFDEAKYNEVVDVTSLRVDLELFPFGDMTVVGDRGVSLSGGQKARINLARTLYSDADVYVLDDPLSAVDVKVGREIFKNCIKGYLKDKIVILATHQLQFINGADQVLVLKAGHVLALGSCEEVMKKDIDLLKSDTIKDGEDTEDDGQDKGKVIGDVNEFHKKMQQNGNPPIVKEDTGPPVTLATYWTYIRAGGGYFMLPTLLLLILITQAVYNGSDYWLSVWTSSEERKASSGEKSKVGHKGFKMFTDLSRSTYLEVYIYLMVGMLFLCLGRSILYFVVCTRASITLHNRLFESVIRAPMSVFDKTPIGLILNRVSRDIGVIDDCIPPTAFDVMELATSLIGILVLIAFIDLWLIIPSLVLVFTLLAVRVFYIPTARGLRRIEAMTRTPVFSHMATTIHGLATIRAFKVQKWFIDQFDEDLDKHTSCWFLFVSCSRGFGMFLDSLTALYVIAVVVYLTILTPDARTGSQVGLAISSALLIMGCFQWGVRQSIELEANMNSVARVHEYSQLPAEPPLESEPDKKPPEDWPSKGEIEFKSVSMVYSKKEPPVLKQISLKIKGGEKVGIVGRSGAGKSSIVTAVYRLAECEGVIAIDGVDTKSIGLHDLRKKLSIIPQDPIIFQGTVRYNLDPFGKLSDQMLWNALEEVHLRDQVLALPGHLDADFSEGGNNLSVGQKQLICLARAVLRNNKVLLIDEATANVDPKTDALIQTTIRTKFSGCTVLTIAHRLDTIMDCDRVLVLDKGQVLEFESPFLLLQKSDSRFTSMVNSAGSGTSVRLGKIAKSAFDSKLIKQ